MTYKPGPRASDSKNLAGGGLRGRDRKQGELTDRRRGAFDKADPRSAQWFPDEKAQPDADVGSETGPDDEGSPERLRRMSKAGER